jgi:hypothetical protein
MKEYTAMFTEKFPVTCHDELITTEFSVEVAKKGKL